MTIAWDNFERDFLHANSWAQRKDGFPADLLDALSPDEKIKAEEILIAKLDGSDDWPIRAMGHLKCNRSIPKLRQLLDHKMPSIRATSATAIYELTGDSTVEPIVTMIAKDTSVQWMFRLDAVLSLGYFDTDSARKTLDELESDAEYLISYNAQRTPRRRKSDL